jgi:hypothetical protein
VPFYTRTRQDVGVLPDLSLEVQPGQTVDLPEGFWVDDAQAAAAGYELAAAPTDPVPPAVDVPAPAPAQE